MKSTRSTLNGKGLTLRQLAVAIGVDPGQLSKESHRAGFPSRRVNGRRRFDATAVHAWREQNIVQRQESSSGAGQTPMPADDESVKTLTSGKAGALDIAKSAVQLCAVRVANAAVAGNLSASTLDSLKKSLGELRVAESQYLEIGQRSGELMPRESCDNSVRFVMATAVQLLERVVNEFSQQLNRWLGDVEFMALDAESRARSARQFCERVAYDARLHTAAGLRKIYEDAERERTG